MPKDDIARIYTVSLVILAKFSGRQFSSQRQNADEAGSFAEKLEPCESVHQSYKWPLTALQYGQYGQLPPLLHTAADLLGTPPMLGVRLLDFWTRTRLSYKSEDHGIWNILVTSSIRSTLSDLFRPGPFPYQQLHLGACLGQAAFLVVKLPIRHTDLQARRTKSSYAQPPQCREAAPQASENSFALLEGTQEIVLITPGSVLQGVTALTATLIVRFLDFLVHLVSAKRFVRPPNRICKLA